MRLDDIFVYSQSTGDFGILRGDHDGEYPLYIWQGYSGKGIGRNNPLMQKNVGEGPIPRGNYLIHDPIRHKQLGPLAFRLSAADGTELFGRSGFYIHGDNKTNDASEGCIVLPREAREFIKRKGLRVLRVCH